MMTRYLLLGLTIWLAACSTTATLLHQDGHMTEARIERSDSDTLYILDDNGQETAVSRADIVDIDHPGNVVAIAMIPGFLSSLAVAIPSGLVLSASNDDISSFVSGFFLIVGVSSAVVSGIFGINGIIQWAKSKDRASGTDSVSWDICPTVIIDHRGDLHGGFVWGLRF